VADDVALTSDEEPGVVENDGELIKVRDRRCAT
jgi:hypothetical protein